MLNSNDEKVLIELENMKDGDVCYVNWCEEGGGEVRFINGVYELYEIPQYGGEGMFEDYYTKDQLEELIKKANEWT